MQWLQGVLTSAVGLHHMRMEYILNYGYISTGVTETQTRTNAMGNESRDSGVWHVAKGPQLMHKPRAAALRRLILCIWGSTSWATRHFVLTICLWNSFTNFNRLFQANVRHKLLNLGCKQSSLTMCRWSSSSLTPARICTLVWHTSFYNFRQWQTTKNMWVFITPVTLMHCLGAF